MINKLILFNLEDSCKRLKGDGSNNVEIARALSNESGKTISAVNVGRYFKAEKHALSQAINANKKLQTEKAKTYLNSIEQLSHVNTETLEILKEAKVTGDLKTALQAIARVEAQLELQAKLLGEISTPPENTQIREIIIREVSRSD